MQKIKKFCRFCNVKVQEEQNIKSIKLFFLGRYGLDPIIL